MFAAKDVSDRRKLPLQEDFSKALYTFDIGQNDLSMGFRQLSNDQLRAQLPDMINQFASAIQVMNHSFYLSDRVGYI